METHKVIRENREPCVRCGCNRWQRDLDRDEWACKNCGFDWRDMPHGEDCDLSDTFRRMGKGKCDCYKAKL